VKKVLGARNDKQLRPGRQAVEPLNGLVDVDELVLVALNDQPWALRLSFKAIGKSIDRRRDADQPTDIVGQGGPDGDRGAERKAAQPKRYIRVTLLHPFERCTRVIEFADRIIIAATTTLRAAKIESQRSKSGTDESPRQSVRDLIVHSAAMLRMRMADHCCTVNGVTGWQIKQRFKLPNGALQQQFLRSK